MNVTLTKEFIKNQILLMREFLKTGGMDIKQSNAYNLLARMYGFKDWNTLSAMLKG
jgi:hypothetical protein